MREACRLGHRWRQDEWTFDERKRRLGEPLRLPDVANRSDSTSVEVTVCGDPVVGQALVLLLWGFSYGARFLPLSTVGEPGVLKGTQLLLITATPQLSDERRKAILALIQREVDAAKIPLLQLLDSSEALGDRGERGDGSRHVVPWPCSIEELKQRIEEALLINPKEDQSPCRSPRP
jgi:hypothetical protein